MKKIFPLVFGAFSLLSLNTTPSRAQGSYADYDQYDQYDQYDPNYNSSYNNNYVDYQDFYDGLAPYGRWIYDVNYGYVWMPNVDPSFKPYYSNGYWAMTQYGNTWISNYVWGWAPFHYGRWTYDGYYGWLWIPDTQWAPAWVSWRTNNQYYGWAPLGPGLNLSISVNVIPMDWWIFLSPNYLYQRQFHRYCSNDWQFNRNLYHRTHYIYNTYNNHYYTGPRSQDYYQRTGRNVSMYNLANNTRRGTARVQNNNIRMYMPQVQNTRSAAPSKIVTIDRAISRRPETYNTSNSAVSGRSIVLRETPVANQRINNNNIETTQRNHNSTIQNGQRNDASMSRTFDQGVNEHNYNRNVQQQAQQNHINNNAVNERSRVNYEHQNRQSQTQWEQQRAQQDAANRQATIDNQNRQRQIQMEQQRAQQDAANRQATIDHQNRQRQIQMEQQRAQQDAANRQATIDHQIRQRQIQMEQQRNTRNNFNSGVQRTGVSENNTRSSTQNEMVPGSSKPRFRGQ